jgi:asparagine synthase (glutamine-hydrolysing)
MNAGFTVQCRDGNAEFRFPGSTARPGRCLVTVARDGASQTVAALIGRLDYRDELAATLPGHPPLHGLTDAELALSVYLHAGRVGLERLEGEFSLVVWDGWDRRLIGMRDPFGGWPLFWTVQGSRPAMGTSLRALAGPDRSPSLDLGYVAKYLVAPFMDAEVACTRTSVPGVQRVLPGTLVEVGAAGESRQHVYWDWPSRIRPVAVAGPSEAAERFGDLLDRAVRERMRNGTVAAHLSGGMDSSSVVILARRRIASTAAGVPLQAISLTYHAAELAGERGYMDLVLAQGGPIRPSFVPADRALGFDWFQQPIPEHDEPYAGLWSLAANRLLADAAARCDADTVLTGVGGDEILSYRPLHLADLLRRGKLVAAVREAAVWAEAQGQGLWSVLHKCAIEPLWPAERSSVPAWIRPEFAREQRLRDRCREFDARMFASPAETSQTLLRLALSTGDWARWHLHAPHGINISHPFQDPRVICYTLGLPRSIRTIPGESKPLLREGMRDLLPEQIGRRREKTGFDGPHARGLDAHLPQLEAMVRKSSVMDSGIFDPDKLMAAMHAAAVGIDGRQNIWIDRVLALVAWAEQRSKGTAVSPRGAMLNSRVPVAARSL